MNTVFPAVSASQFADVSSVALAEATKDRVRKDFIPVLWIQNVLE
jgi:hypothetical protein